MNYFTTKQFSEIWGISERRIIKLCKENRISGAIKNGMIWNIPENAIKPNDNRNKTSKYLNIPKRIMIVGINNEIGHELVPLLQKQGYLVDGICDSEPKYDKDIETWSVEKNYFKQSDLVTQLSLYYSGLIIIETDNRKINNKEWFIKEFSKKMDCESSIILLTVHDNNHLEEKLSHTLMSELGIRINTLYLNVKTNNCLIDSNQLSEDVVALLTHFKNTTGMQINTDGGCIEFDKNGRTKKLESGIYYRFLTYYFKKLNKESYIWCASIMLEDEWTEEHQEMTFRLSNLDAVNRGTKMERIFIFSKSKIPEFKNNKTLNIFMKSNCITLFVDYDEVNEKEPELLRIVGDGWDGINKETLLVDLPADQEQRGYISINKQEVERAYNCFQKLKTYAKDLKEILK